MKLIEPIAVLDCYASGLGAVHILKGGNVRFIVYVEHINEDGELEHVIVQKTVMPIESAWDGIGLACAALAGAVVKTVTGCLTRFH